MTNLELCQFILKSLGNDHTKIIRADIKKGGYYFYLTDSIYIPINNSKDELRDIIVLCHECMHSVQNRHLHILNMLCANVELISFMVLAVNSIYNHFSLLFLVFYILICIISLIVRCILEIPAMLGSFELAKNFCNPKDVCNICKIQTQIGKKIVPGILSFSWSRLVRLILAIILYVVI